MDKTICIDFDGVLHQYWKWNGPTPTGAPVPGSQSFIQALLDAGYRVIICSTRASDHGGRFGIEKWLYDNRFPHVNVFVQHEKPPALVYIDDRGFRFEGDFDAALKFCMDESAMRPWYKRNSSGYWPP